jgi:hypothetical protein
MSVSGCKALLDDRRRHRDHVGAHPGRLDDVDGVADAGDQHLGTEFEVVEDIDDLADQVHAGRADVVEPADERADVGSARLGREPGLRRRKDQRHVHAVFLSGQRLARLDPFLGERHLDDDVRVDAGQVAAFADHAGRIGGHDFGADRTLHRGADLLEDRAVITALLGKQRRVGGHPVQDPQVGKGLNLLEVAGVSEEFHVSFPQG